MKKNIKVSRSEKKSRKNLPNVDKIGSGFMATIEGQPFLNGSFKKEQGLIDELKREKKEVNNDNSC